MTQEQVRHRSPERVEEETPDRLPHEVIDTEKLKADIDSILDEIDDVLSEEEAAETVRNFVQKGGQ